MEAKDLINLMTELSKYPKDQLAKAMHEHFGFEGIQLIEDLWQNIHKVPGTKEFTAGPSMIQSGEGADKGMKDYSNPAPQVGVTKEYEELMSNGVAVFKEMGEVAKALNDTLADLKTAVKSINKPTVKSELWQSLANVQSVIAKAETQSVGHELMDAGMLAMAKKLIEQAEAYIHEVEQREEGEARELATMKAKVSMSDAWDTLMKARVVERFGLKGDGNQADSAVADHEESTTDNKEAGEEGVMHKAEKKKDKKSKKEKAAKLVFRAMKAKMRDGTASKEDVSAAKANFLAIKAERLGADFPVSKADDKKEEEAKKPEHEDNKEEMKKSEGDTEFKKAVMERMNLIEQNLKTNSSHPSVTPILFKSEGIKSEDVYTKLTQHISKAEEDGLVTSGEAEIAVGLAARYQAVGNGNLQVRWVNKQLEQAPVAVQELFTSFAQLH